MEACDGDGAVAALLDISNVMSGSKCVNPVFLCSSILLRSFSPTANVDLKNLKSRSQNSPSALRTLPVPEVSK
jgi:hypothetical protein